MPVYINDDFCDFSIAATPPEQMNEDRIKKQIDFYTEKGGIDAIFFNFNASRAYFDSRTRTPIWEGFAETPEGGTWNGVLQTKVHANMARNLLALYKNVPDPIKFRLDYCRSKNVKFFISMRMNDIHWMDDPNCLLHDDFWREHPELRRAPHRNTWSSQGMDYAKKEVFEHNLALMNEYFDRFEMDGFELDWMRTPPHVRPGLPDNGAEILTQFMRLARAAADKAAQRWNHPVKIAVRVHNTPENALDSGLDVIRWAEEGLVDIVIPSPYYLSTCHDIPIRIWKKLLGDNVEVTPCLESHISSGRGLYNMTDIYADCGFAASFHAQGADGIYMYNHFAGNGYIPQVVAPGVWSTREFPLPPLPYAEGRETQKEFFSIAGNYEEVCRRERRHVFTCNENSFSESGHYTCAYLPAPRSNIVIPFDLGKVGHGRCGKAVIGMPQEETACPQLYCNTVECQLDDQAIFPYYMPRMELDNNMRLLIYTIPENVLHDRLNRLEIKADKPVDYTWVELDLAPA